MDNAVYIVFSATPTGMGKIIRGATRYAVYTTARHFGRLALRVLMGTA